MNGQQLIQVPIEVIRVFQRIFNFVATTFRTFAEAVARNTPMIQRLANQSIARRERIVSLSYRKKKSQAKKWRKWKRRRNR